MTTFARVVVTGGSGRIGRYVVAELARAGHGVVVFDIAPAAPGVAFAEGNVLDLEAVERAVAGAEAVVHLAALDWIVKAPGQDFIHVNVQGTWNVLQAAEAAGVRKIALASSISATGIEEMRADFPPLYLPVDEAHPIEPVEPYSVSKQMVEDAALSFARRGKMAVACLRPVGVAVPGALERFAEIGDDASVRWFNAYVTPEDTARAFRLAIERDTGPWALCFVAAEDTASAAPTLELAARLWSPAPPIRKPGLYRDFPRAALIDTAHAKRTLGFEAASDWLRLKATVGP